MKIKSSYQSGFTVIEGLLIVLVLAVIGFGGYYVWHTQRDKNTTPVTTTSTSSKSSSSTKPSTTKTTKPNPYAGWQSYTLPVEKLSFMYPPGWTMSTEGSGSTWDNITLTASDGSVFSFEDGTPNGGDAIPEAPASNDIPITFLGSQDYLGLTYGEGDRGQGTSDGLISGVLLQTSTNEYGGPNGGYSYPTDKTAVGSSANYGTGVEANFITIGFSLGKQITLQQVSSSADLKTGELIIESMHY